MAVMEVKECRTAGRNNTNYVKDLLTHPWGAVGAGSCAKEQMQFCVNV